jgi:hypothetical protein
MGAARQVAAAMDWSLPYTLGVLGRWKMAAVYCEAVLSYGERIALDGAPKRSTPRRRTWQPNSWRKRQRGGHRGGVGPHAPWGPRRLAIHENADLSTYCCCQDGIIFRKSTVADRGRGWAVTLLELPTGEAEGDAQRDELARQTMDGPLTAWPSTPSRAANQK